MPQMVASWIIFTTNLRLEPSCQASNLFLIRTLCSVFVYDLSELCHITVSKMQSVGGFHIAFPFSYTI